MNCEGYAVPVTCLDVQMTTLPPVPPELPSTGSDPTTALVLGAVVVLAGTATLVANRVRAWRRH